MLVTRRYGELGSHHLPVSARARAVDRTTANIASAPPHCFSIPRLRQTATATGSPMLWLTSSLISGSATLSQWTGGASFGLTRVLPHGSDGLLSTTCTLVSLLPSLDGARLTSNRLECLGPVRRTFKSTRYCCSKIADIVCRLIPCNKLSHSMRFAPPILSRSRCTMVSRLIRFSITSVT